MNLGQTIKFARIVLNLTQVQFAIAIGITSQTLSLIERNKFEITNNIISKIYFSIKELLNDDNICNKLENYQFNALNSTTNILEKYLLSLNSNLKNTLLNKSNINLNNKILDKKYKYILCGNEFSIIKLGGELLNVYSLQKDSECLYFHDDKIITSIIENNIKVDLGVVIVDNDLMLLRKNLLALKQIEISDIIVLLNQDNILDINVTKENVLNLINENNLNLKKLIIGTIPKQINNKNILDFISTSRSICNLIVEDKLGKSEKNKNNLAKILK